MAGRLGKFDLVRAIVSQLDNGSEMRRASVRPTLLDVGCRGCELGETMGNLVDYTGVDQFQNARGTVDVVTNLDEGLPFPEEAYDYVVALDILEHVDDFQRGLEELLRVTRRHLLVMLPNVAYALHRVAFLIHGAFSRQTDKYDLEYGRTGRQDDRHRWVTVLDQTDRFMQCFTDARGLSLKRRWCFGSRKREAFAGVARRVRLPASVWVPAALYVMSRSRPLRADHRPSGEAS